MECLQIVDASSEDKIRPMTNSHVTHISSLFFDPVSRSWIYQHRIAEPSDPEEKGSESLHDHQMTRDNQPAEVPSSAAFSEILEELDEAMFPKCKVLTKSPAEEDNGNISDTLDHPTSEAVHTDNETLSGNGDSVN